MKKKNQLLSAIALSVGLSLSASVPVFAALPSQVPGQAAIPSLAPMLEKVLPAVVSVQVEGTAVQSQRVPEELKKYFGDESPDQQAQPFEGLGSGVIIDAAKGYILTNNHVISQADKISVQLNDGRDFDAKLIGGDDQSDIALLQVQNPSNLTQIAIADSDKLRVGDFAVAVGNPFGLGQTATSGIVSALGRSGLNLEGLENFIQTDASINRGNSGGALLNLNGELIGINTAILAPGGGSIGIGFAIPSNMAKTLAQQLIQFGEIKRGLLGIKGMEMSADIAKAFNINVQRGAFVSEVLPNSGSAKAGMQTPWFNVNYTMIWSGHRYALGQNFKENRVEGFADHGISLSRDIYTAYGVFSTNLEALNLLNKNYEVVRFFPMPGRSFRATLVWKF